MTLDETVEKAERTAIMNALFLAGGNVTQAADALGRNRTEFYKKCRKVNINLDDYRAAFGRSYKRKGEA